MAVRRILAVTVIAACMATTAAFACSDTSKSSTAPTANNSTGITQKKAPGNFKDAKVKSMDPVKLLESRKEKIQAQLKDGKITKEQADKELAAIDANIKQINDFNALTLDQKKQKLIDDFKANIEKQVTAGKLTREKADQMIKSYTDQMSKWDGKGFGFGFFGGMPKMPTKGIGGTTPPAIQFKRTTSSAIGVKGQAMDPVKGLENAKARIQEQVKAGKLTQDKADKQIAQIDAKIKEIKDFNALTLDQKKAKLISNYKASIQKLVTAGKLTQDKADQLIKSYTDKINKWDGKSVIGFGAGHNFSPNIKPNTKPNAKPDFKNKVQHKSGAAIQKPL